MIDRLKLVISSVSLQSIHSKTSRGSKEQRALVNSIKLLVSFGNGILFRSSGYRPTHKACHVVEKPIKAFNSITRPLSDNLIDLSIGSVPQYDHSTTDKIANCICCR
jgi:hypothetical protein